MARIDLSGTHQPQPTDGAGWIKLYWNTVLQQHQGSWVACDGKGRCFVHASHDDLSKDLKVEFDRRPEFNKRDRKIPEWLNQQKIAFAFIHPHGPDKTFLP